MLPGDSDQHCGEASSKSVGERAHQKFLTSLERVRAEDDLGWKIREFPLPPQLPITKGQILASNQTPRNYPRPLRKYKDSNSLHPQQPSLSHQMPPLQHLPSHHSPPFPHPRHRPDPSDGLSWGQFAQDSDILICTFLGAKHGVSHTEDALYVFDESLIRNDRMVNTSRGRGHWEPAGRCLNWRKKRSPIPRQSLSLEPRVPTREVGAIVTNYSDLGFIHSLKSSKWESC